MRSSIIILLFFSVPIFAQTKSLQITPLTGDFYIYTTYGSYQGAKVMANGMYMVTREGAVLFDTPWDTTQFQPLLDSIKQRHDMPVIICIATHWHSDRTEGLAYYKEQGIKTYTTALTDEWSRKNNKKRAEFLMANDTVFSIGQHSFETYYPGEGHTADNIVIWFGKEKILYAGCLVKGVDAKNLGNTSDGNVDAYESTLKKVKRKFPRPRYIIISHSDWRDSGSLKHSIKLAKEL